MRYILLLITAIFATTAAFLFLHYGNNKQIEKPLIICTTTIIADAVCFIASDYCTVKTIMGPGVDPHLYRARESDVTLLTSADFIFYNGLHLEGKMADLFKHMAQYVPTIALAEEIPASFLIFSEDIPDPHVWHDVTLYKLFIPAIVRGLSMIDPGHQSFFEKRATQYTQILDTLDKYIQKKIRSIAAHQRVLITAHDAFSYFGKRYGMRVVGLQGMSTDAPLTLYDMHTATQIVKDTGVSAIFLESSIPAQSIHALQYTLAMQGYNVTIGTELFSDSLDEPGATAGSYSGMIKQNVDTIVSALRK